MRSWAAALVMLAGGHASAQTETGPVTEVGTVIATAGVGGELARPRCDAEETLEAQAFARAAGAIAAAGQEGTLILDTGGLVARHGVARFASETAPDALAEMVAGLGYDALAFGEADLGDPREMVLRRTRALTEAGVPTLLTNLRCDASAAAMCDALVTHEDGVPTFTLGAERVAVFAFLAPSAAQRVAPDRRAGLHLLPLTESIRAAVRGARARGAQTVITIIDSGLGAAGVAEAIGAVAGLEGDDKPDAVLSSGGGNELLFARPAGFRPAVVAPPPRGVVSLQVRRQASGRYDLLATPLEPTVAPAPAVTRFIERVGRPYCDTLGDPLVGGTLAEPITPAGLAELLAGVMRQSTHADVAVLNVDAIDSRWQPAHDGSLSASDVQVAVQYDEPLVRAEVSASWLRNLARSAPPGVILQGLAITGAFTSSEAVKVNGRPLDDTAEYEVVTLRFLAEGGDAGVLAAADFEPAEGTLRSVLTEYLGVSREEDPRETLEDPYDLLEWTSRVNTDLTFTGSAVRDSGGYQEGPLTNQPQVLIGLNANLELNALSRNAAWENIVNASYSLARTASTDGFDEGADQITYRTSGQYRGLRTMRDKIYVPDLIVEGLLRTEFSQDDERDSHFMNVRFVAGPQWRLHRYLETRLVGGFEILEALDSDMRSVQPGVGAQLKINPWALLQDGLRKLLFSFTADYFLSGPGGRNRHLLQGLFDMQFNISRSFALGLNVTMYGLSENGSDFSFALGTTASMRVGWTGRWLND